MSSILFQGENVQIENPTRCVSGYETKVTTNTGSVEQLNTMSRFQIGPSTPDLTLNESSNGNGIKQNLLMSGNCLSKAGTETSLTRVSTCDTSLYDGIQRGNVSSTQVKTNGNRQATSINEIFLNKKFTTNACNKDKKSEEKEDNLAAVLHGVKDLKLENRPIPKITPNQVLLEVEVCGICGTDVHFYENGKLGPWALQKPMIIGHEASGTVRECGECVKGLKPGDKVAIEPQVACRKCPLCKAGEYHMCPHLYFCAAPPNDGNLCRFFAHDYDFCHKIPCNMDHEMATLMEPLSVGVHACKKGHITSGDSVLVLGSGPVGLATMLAARAYGASSVVVVDIDSFKLKKAMEMGADCAINCKDVPEDEVVKKVHEILGHAPNKTVDCCGFESAIRIGMLATGACGKMVLLGLGKDDQCLPIMDVVYKEIDIIGAIRYANDYPTAIDMVANDKVNPKPLITHHFKLEDAVKAFELAAKREENYIKIVIHANPKWKPDDGKC